MRPSEWWQRQLGKRAVQPHGQQQHPRLPASASSALANAASTLQQCSPHRFRHSTFRCIESGGRASSLWYLNKQQEENAKLSLPEGRTIPGRAPAGREACSRNRYAFAASLASLYDDLSPADSRCCAFVRSTACSTGSSRRSRSVHLCQGTLAPRSRESTCTDSKVTQACRRAHSVLSV